MCVLQVVPARGNNCINVSFTPFANADVSEETDCNGFALGYMSLADKVSYLSILHSFSKTCCDKRSFMILFVETGCNGFTLGYISLADKVRHLTLSLPCLLALSDINLHPSVLSVTVKGLNTLHSKSCCKDMLVGHL